MSILLSHLFLAVLLVSGAPQTWHVPDDFPTIQAALDGVAAGDTVIVRPGTWHEAIDFHGREIHLRSESGPFVTILDGQGAISVVSFVSGEGPGAILEGFTVTGGLGAGYNGYGAVNCYNGSAPTIRGNIIAGNTGYLGGGVVARSASPRIVGNVIRDNVSLGVGGGIGCHDAGTNAVIEGNLIEGNSAGNHFEGGGGINVTSASSVTLLGNVIRGNTSAGRGGGLYVKDVAATIRANLFEGNTAADEGGGLALAVGASAWGLPQRIDGDIFVNNTAQVGGGIWTWYASNTDVVNCTVVGNHAVGAAPGGVGGGLGWSAFSDGTIANTILWGNTATTNGSQVYVGAPFSGATGLIEHSVVQGGAGGIWEDGGTLAWGPCMQSADPLFVDAAGFDLHLRFGSPCRDAGDNLAPGLGAVDFEGDPRIASGIADIGADEFHRHLYVAGDVTPGGTFAVKVVGTPGGTPVGLYFAASVLDPPLASKWGPWFLGAPIFGPILLAPIPADGVLAFQATLPAMPPAPYDIALQGHVGAALTNLERLEVR